MGNITGNKGNNKLVDAALAKNKAKERRVKLLLFGTGECGKTTIARQMRLIYGDEKINGEIKKFRNLICYNVIEGAALTILAGRMLFGIPFDNNPYAEQVLVANKDFKNNDDCNLNSEQLVHALIYLYKSSEEFQSILARRNEYQIQDGWEYFADKLTNHWPTWGGPTWSPNEEDLLHSRVRTTGKVTVDFEYGGTAYQLIDVGGQQNERIKFITLFSQVDALLYVASLSEYNQTLFEDNTQNRLVESLDLWTRTINSPNFHTTHFILFLNKLDLFKRKFYHEKQRIVPKFRCRTKPPEPEEEEDERCAKAIAWFEDLFIQQAKTDKQAHVRIYTTSAMDRDSIQVVVNYCVTYLAHHGVGTTL